MRSVAFFDSGIGGLTVLAACRKHLPKALFYYYGDNERAPYGNLSEEKITEYTFRAFEEFERLRVGAAVIACNTVSAVCLEALRRRFAFPIVGAEPAVYLAAKKGWKKIFVLSTRATYESVRFRALCERVKREFSGVELTAYPCDGLAGYIERGTGRRDLDVKTYLPRGEPQCVVLGCTHYVYVAEQIRRFYGCDVLDGNAGIARRLSSILLKSQIENHDRPLFAPEQPFFSKTLPPSAECLIDERVVEGGRTGFLEKKSEGLNPLKNGKIVFVGSGSVVNETIYEQMFV